MSSLPVGAIDRIVASFSSIDLGDPRRTERLLHTVRKLAENPSASLPKAMGSDAEIEGSYRLLKNRHVTFDRLLVPYIAATNERAREVGAVLAIHDTTTCEFAHADPEDVGYLSTGAAGFMAHYCLVVSRDEQWRPLGLSALQTISRKTPPAPRGTKKPKKGGPETKKNPDRESLRWAKGLELSEQNLAGCDVIHVADRESDDYELFAFALERRMRFVFRSRVGKRRVRLTEGEKTGAFEHVQTLSRTLEGKFPVTIELTRRGSPTAPKEKKSHFARSARQATVLYSAARIELPRPVSAPKDTPASIELNMVRLFEPSPPGNEPAVEWLLFTTEPIDTEEQIKAVVEIYRHRWLIEECNKALKTGCSYEDRELETEGALLNMLALSLPIAIELLWLRSVCRTNPDMPARGLFSDVRLQILKRMGARKLSDNPTIAEALWAVAGLGGHMRGNGDPGWQVLYRGFVQLLDYERGWLAAEAARDLQSR